MQPSYFALAVLAASACADPSAPAQSQESVSDAGSSHDAAFAPAEDAALLDAGVDKAGEPDGAQPASDSAVACVADEYCDDALWLCRPDLSTDHCAETQTVTVLAADGSEAVTTLSKAAAPDVDCFYVYPTVALTGAPGNVPDYSNLDDILVPLRMQALPFSSLCRVFAPLYHQMTLASYLSPDKEKYMEVAYQDVDAAWNTYLTHWNGGRDVILLGHSQGSHLLRRLLQREVETNDAIRQRLVVAFAIGATGDITVPVGKVIGGTFTKLPLCTTKEERGCIIAYDSAAVSAAGPSLAKQDVACVNPAAIGSPATATFKRSLFPSLNYAGEFAQGPSTDFPTDLIEIDGSYSGACARGSSGAMQLQVSYTPPQGAVLKSLIDLKSARMHPLDYSFPLGDLLDVAQVKIASRTTP